MEFLFGGTEGFRVRYLVENFLEKAEDVEGFTKANLDLNN
jgi:hypothetical protein